MDQQHPFYTLTPDMVINAVESAGYLCDLRTLTLNSYENRVFQVGVENQQPIVAKFYRPHRWSDAQILEEHQFSQELFEEDISVVPPLRNDNGDSLFTFENFRFALFPRRGGHAPEFDDPDSLVQLGTLVARLHAVGGRSSYQTRPRLTVEEFAENSIDYLNEHFIPDELKPSYQSLCRDILAALRDIEPLLNSSRQLRTHGDLHVGNILWRNDSGHLVDLDDSRMAPAIQDLWMFLSGDRLNQQQQLDYLLDGYMELYDFDARQLQLLEPLRTLRIIHYSAWLARRWDDPAFPRNFPWFNTVRYWSDHILTLREQLAALHEPALCVR